VERRVTLVGGNPTGSSKKRRVTYFISAHDRKDKLVGIKIGSTTVGPSGDITANVKRRLLNLQTGSVLDLKLIGVYTPSDIERKAHRLLQRHRLRGEFFAPHKEVISFVEDVLQIDRLLQKALQAV
jgi:Meiotically up-regulated gene 113